MTRTMSITTEIPDSTEIDLKAPGDEPFDSIISKRQAAQEQIKKLKIAVAEYDLTLGVILDLNAVKRVMWRGGEADYVVSRREGGERKQLDPIKLLQLGVPASTIEAATRVTRTRAGISVRRASERNEAAGGEGTGVEGIGGMGTTGEED